MTSFRLLLACVLLFLAAILPSPAQDNPLSFTLDLPSSPTLALPAWLGQPMTPTGTFASLDLPVTPPDPADSLLVTVVFQEKNGGFLRISWHGADQPSPDPANALPGPGEAGQSAVLCDNFYEGIGMGNQRTLLISPEDMKTPGSLRFQAGDQVLGISSIKLEWVQKTAALSSPSIPDVLVTSGNGQTQTASDLAGLPAVSRNPAWNGHLVDVPLTDNPVRIEEGVEFAVQTAGLPSAARLSLKEAGLPWGQHLVIWCNGQRAGTIAPAVPALSDPGYQSSGAPYIGWREGAALLPVANLVVGANTLQVSAESDDPAAPPPTTAAPLAVKDMDFQLQYLPPAAATVVEPANPGASTAPDPETDRLSAPSPAGLSLLTLPITNVPAASTPEVSTP